VTSEGAEVEDKSKFIDEEVSYLLYVLALFSVVHLPAEQYSF
jgi:hypothetical protein